MSTTLAERLAVVATRLVCKHGRTITITYEGTEANVDGEEWKGKKPGSTDTPKAVFAEEMFEYLVGADVQQGDRVLLIDGPSVTGVLNVRVQILDSDGQTRLTLVRIQKIQPGDTTVAYIVQVR